MAKKTTLSNLILQQNILTVLLLTLVVVGAWVGMSIYFSYSRSTIATTDAALIAPLNPKLDSALFDRLSSRKSWSSEELAAFTPTVVVVTTEGSSAPRPTAAPSPREATSSASQP